MRKILSSAVLLVAAAWSWPAPAQTIYRCGNTYSQQPCAGGAPVQADDPRSAGQRAQTGAAARRDAKTADAMEKTRLKDEGKPVQAYIPAAKADAQDAPLEKKPVLAKPKKPQYFTAVAPKKPGETAAKKKAKTKKAKPAAT